MLISIKVIVYQVFAMLLLGCCPCPSLASQQAAFPSSSFQSDVLLSKQHAPAAPFARTSFYNGALVERMSITHLSEHKRCGKIMAVAEDTATAGTTTDDSGIRVEEFMEQARGIGKVHLFINSCTGPWKARTTLDHLRYDDSVEEAWDACLIHEDDEAEITMFIYRVASASFKQDKVLGVPQYIIQFLDSMKTIAFSFTLMADPKTNEYQPEQVETYNELLKSYGPEVKFANKA